MPYVDSTAVLYPIIVPRPAEIRTAGDLWPPNLLSIPHPPNVKESGTSESVRPKRTQSGGSDGLKEFAEPRMSPWLIDTLARIEEQTASLVSRKRGHDLKRLRGMVETAQMAATILASASPSIRPQLNFDEEDVPSFATSTKQFYIHLTVDAPGRLTWYADAGTEQFREDVPFDGRRLPEELRVLLSLQNI